MTLAKMADSSSSRPVSLARRQMSAMDLVHPSTSTDHQDRNG